MDDARFDALAHSLVTTGSRRSLTRLLGGTSLGGVLLALGGNEAAAAKLNGGARCSTKTQCKSGRCLNPDRCDCTKKRCRCTCACSRTAPVVRCIAPPNPCKKAVCNATGRCVIRNKCPQQAESTCGRTGECSNGTCHTYGTTTECGTASCSDDSPFDFDGESTAVRHFCDGNGTCVPQEETCVREEPETCGQSGACDEGTCTKHGIKTACASSSCVEGDETQIVEFGCDGAGNCVQRTSKCIQSVCVDGKCRKVNGLPCSGAAQCASGFCVDSVCCERASCNDGVACTNDTCEAGTGVCTHAANDSLCDPGFHCDATAGCQPDP